MMTAKWYICLFTVFGSFCTIAFDLPYEYWTLLYRIPSKIVLLTFPLLMNKSLVFSLLKNFTVIYSVFTVLTLHICLIIIEVYRSDGDIEHGLCSVIFFVLRFLTSSSVFLIDALPQAFATSCFRVFLFGLLTIWFCTIIVSRYFDENSEKFQINILSFTLDVDSMVTSSLSVMTVFIFKNFIFSIFLPNSFVMFTTSLRHRSTVNSPITCICCYFCNVNDIEEMDD
jgi:hypothetical protein